MAPWLQALAHHPVWTLPPPASSSSSSNDLARSTAPHPGAQAAQAALGRSSSTAAPLSQSASSRSLFGLAHPPSSSSPSSASPSATKPHPHPLKRSRSSHTAAKGSSAPERRIKGGRTTRVAVVRGTDLVVAVGSELRMASLAQVKSRATEASELPVEDVELGDYKVLNTPAVTFEIQQLVVNPTSKLLAVVGAHSVVVVVLPRRGWTNTVTKTLECRSLPVGAFYHSLPGSPAVASVLWHPLGHDASSLVVLTSDATLREYTVSESLDEPAQTLSFVRSGSGGGAGAARKGGFGLDAVERDARTAVALCVGEGRGDWGPLTLYALMRNGDVVSMCPFLPKKASLTPNYVHALSAFVSTKVDYLSSSSPFPALEKRYSLQQQYVSSLVRQVTTSAPPPFAYAEPDLAAAADDEHDPSTPRDVVAPSRPALAPRLQGPFLLQPAPAELDNGADGAACDLAYLTHAATSSQGEAGSGEVGEDEGDEVGEGVGVLAIAYRDGKVDLCLEVEKVEARFVGEAPPPTAAAAASARSSWSGALVLRNRSTPRRGGRGGFGLDSDDDDDEPDEPANDDDAADLPTLAVFESIDLGLATALSPAGSEHVVSRGLAHNAPVLVRDPLHGADTLYVRHALGAHCLFLGPWLGPMEEALRGAARDEDGEGEDEEGLERKLREGVLGAQGGTEVCWVLKTVGAQGAEEEGEGEGEGAAAQPVEGLALLNDVYLGYSLILVTAALQPVGIELALRIDDSATALDGGLAASTAAGGPATPAKPTAAAASTEPAYVSLLSQSPFTVPAILSRPRTALPVLPRLPTTTGELRITPDTLRQLGKHVQATQTAMRDLVAASGVVSARVELQMRELARQVDKVRELDERRAELGRSVGAGAAGAGQGGEAGGVEARVRAAEERQHALLARTDRVLQRLVEGHQPQVSAVERKWFDELERLSDQVDGGAGDDADDSWSAAVAAAAGGGSGAPPLALRAQRLEAQMELLRPALEELRRKEEAKRAAGTPARNGAGGMGQSQLVRVEGLLSDEAKILADAKRKVERLTSALASASLVD
ncbi:hypothetical protein JCM8208_004711 [Rhodotorula glutinis]